MRKTRVLFLSVLSTLIFITAGCNIGMGQQIDLEAPVLTITSPANLSNVHKNVTLKGTCTDNIGVTSVVITNYDQSYTYGNATISGNTWSFDMTLEEGEVTLRCSATDKAKNEGVTSYKTLTLLVDETAPESLTWYVDRGNGIQTPLLDLDELKSIDTTISRNKDYPQNQEFSVYGRFYDAMSISEVTLFLKDEEGKTLISKTLSSDEASENYIGNGKSIFTPEFHFTHNELVAADSALVNDKHYLKAIFFVKDQHGNERTGELNWLLWHPESDIPGVEQSQVVDGKLEIRVNSTIPFDFFDDDGLAEIYYDLLDTNNPSYTVENFKTSESVRDSFKSIASNKKTDVSNAITVVRDETAQLTTPRNPCQLYLVCLVKDIYGNWNALTSTVLVTDEAKPLLYIESPEENTIPVIESDGKTFNIKGYSLDARGSSYVKIAYVPAVSETMSAGEKENAAKAKFETDTTAKGSKTKYSDGIIVWHKGLSAPVTVDSMVKEGFEFSFDLFGDFESSLQAKDKFFEIMLVDTDGNKVYRQFQVKGDTLPPTVKFANPANDMAVIDYNNEDLNIIVKGEKTSGLGMKFEEYKITYGETEYTLANGGLVRCKEDGTADPAGLYVKLTVTQAQLSNMADVKKDSQPQFMVTGCDLLGNTCVGIRTVVLSSLPKITGIFSDKSNGTFKAGDEITFIARFTAPVRVTGTPVLNLYYTETDKNNGTNVKTANYVSGSETEALNFSYTVPENAVSSKIFCTGIALPDGAKIETNAAASGDAHIDTITDAEIIAGKEFALDGVKPVIESIEISAGRDELGRAAYEYLSANNEITAKITLSENILITGSPVLVLKTASGTLNFTFQSMSSNVVSFIHKITSSSANGIVGYDKSIAFSTDDLKTITDSVGNPLKLTSGTGSSSIIIDTVKPSAPKLMDGENEITADTNFNENKEFTVSGIEDDAKKVEYSINGGTSWNELGADGKITLGSGEYIVKLRQFDPAGNVSDSGDGIKMEINGTFPNVESLVVANADGKYKAGDKIQFKIFFANTVKVATVDAATLTFTDKDGNNSKTIKAVKDTAGSNYVLFEYTVPVNSDMKGIIVTGVNFTANVKDAYDNDYTKYDGGTTEFAEAVSKYFTKTDGGTRVNIIMDGVKPKIATGGYSPANNGVYTANGDFIVELTFDEEVYKESGTIILQRKGDWGIPAVLSTDEFNSIYNKLTSAADKNKLVLTTVENGAEVDDTDYRTGQPCGPYKKITQGLKVDSGKYVPDTTTKYVLDFELGLFDSDDSVSMYPYSVNKNVKDDGTGTPTPTTVTVGQIREVLEKTGYHQHTVETNTSSVTVDQADKTKVTINFGQVENGIEWEVIIPSTSFRDATGNTYAGLTSGVYTVWSDKVATPVIRVDRYSHGYGAKEPIVAEGEITSTITINKRTAVAAAQAANSAGAIAPKGYARVRVDSQTPGAGIYYMVTTDKSLSKDVTDYNDKTYTSDNYKVFGYDVLGDIATEDLTLTSGGTEFTKVFPVGDGSYTVARKDYVAAYASRSNLTQSETGVEGVYKTVVYIYDKDMFNEQMNMEGGTTKGGEPNVSGFPVRDGPSDLRYSKNMYYDSTTKYHVWNSYEIVSTEWAILLRLGDHNGYNSKDYPPSSYGQCTYLYNYESYDVK